MPLKSEMSYMIFEREKNLFKGWLLWHKNNLRIWGLPSGIKLLFFILFLYLIFISVIGSPSVSEWMKKGWYGLILIPILIFFIDFLPYAIVRKLSRVYRMNIFEIVEDCIIFGQNKDHRDKVLYKDIRKISYSRYLGMGITGILLSKTLFYISDKLAHFSIEYFTSEGLRKILPVPLDLSDLPIFLKIIIQKANLKKAKPNKWSLYAEWQRAHEVIYPVEIDEKYPLYPSLISSKQLEIDRNFIIFLIILFLTLLILFVIIPRLGLL